MFKASTLSPYLLGLAGLALIASLIACSQSPQATPSNPAASPKSGSHILTPSGKAVTGRIETVLGSKRIKGKIASMQDSELGATVSDYHFELGTDTDGDGAANEHAEAELEIAGFGKNKVVLDQENYPVMSNQQDSLTVKNQTTGNVRTYSADQDLFNYSVSEGGHELSVKTLPDGTWTVNGEAAATPEDVAELVMKSPLIAEASVHGLMLMYETFNQNNKVPVEVLDETLAPAHCTTDGALARVAATYGDPKPLLKAILKLKLKQEH